MITIVNYGMGNLGSLLNMLRRVGVKAQVVSGVDEIAGASKLILPGVGAFDAAMQRINGVPGLREVLDRKALEERVPILGVCLGMQLLTNASEEGTARGFGWIAGEARRFPRDVRLKVPHMGWNTARVVAPNALTAAILVDAKYYFVHSYYVKVEHRANSVMESRYGIEFDAAIANQNIFGVQFHPEKSHRFGMQVLANFAAL